MIHGLGKRTRLQRIGKIRIGEKDSRGLPRSLDHFKIVMDDGFEEIAEAVKEKYGEKPKRLTVYLPGEPDRDEIWSPWYRRYTQSGLICKGDGVTGHEIGRDGQLVPRDCAEKGCPYAKPNEKGQVACKPTGILTMKLYGVEHPGSLQLTMRGWTQVDLAHSFLNGLAIGGGATGKPFDLIAERVKGRKGPFTRIKFAARNDLQPVEVNEVETEEVEGVAVVDETTGEVLGTPELPEDGPAQTLASMINEAIKNKVLVGKSKQKALKTLVELPTMSKEEVEKTFDRMADFIMGIEATLDEKVKDHPEDEPLAKYAWEKLPPGERARLGIKVGNYNEMTRREVRLAIDAIENLRLAKS